MRRALLLCTALLAACAGRAERPGTPPRHVLLITLESTRADHLSCYLYPRTTSCNEYSEEQRQRGENLSIDDLAQQGVLFTQAYAPSGDGALSLASLLGGGAPPAAAGARTLAECLRAQGFRCAAFVAGSTAAAPELARGFESFASGAGADPDYDAVRQATQWLHAQLPGDQRPLFVWLHLAGPTPPWQPATLGQTPFGTLFTDADYAGTADGSAQCIEAIESGARAASGEDLAQLVALYDGEIARSAYLARTFVQLWAGLFPKEQPNDYLADSILILAGSNGAELRQHGSRFDSAGSLYGAGLRVPLVLRHPRSLTGSRALSTAVELADVMPTALEWLGFECPPGLAGRSLLGLTDRHPAQPFESRPVVARAGELGSSACDGRFRLVERHAGAGAPQLERYELELDPLEKNAEALLDAAVEQRLRDALAPRTAAAGAARD